MIWTEYYLLNPGISSGFISLLGIPASFWKKEMDSMNTMLNNLIQKCARTSEYVTYLSFLHFCMSSTEPKRTNVMRQITHSKQKIPYLPRKMSLINTQALLTTKVVIPKWKQHAQYKTESSMQQTKLYAFMGIGQNYSLSSVKNRDEIYFSRKFTQISRVLEIKYPKCIRGY